jgi:lactosylceramide 4-alpha-galactosyltransferase
MNQDAEVFVLFTSQVGFRNNSRLPIFDALRSYPNINFNHLDLKKYSHNTPVEGFIKSKKLFRSLHVVSHTSDVLRYLTLWKYGGTYLDLDTITMKSFSSMKPNFAAPQDEDYVDAGIINLEPESKFADLFIKEIATNFDGSVWVS